LYKKFSGYGSTEIGGGLWGTSPGLSRDQKMNSVGMFTIRGGQAAQLLNSKKLLSPGKKIQIAKSINSQNYKSSKV